MRLIYVRQYFRRRRPSEPALTRSRLDVPISAGGHGKKFIMVRTPTNYRLRVVAPQFGGGGAHAEPLLASTTPEISQSAWAEAMASTVDDLLEFDIVPPTELKMDRATGRVFSVQKFVPNAVTLNDFRKQASHPDVNRNEIMKVLLFDLIVGSTDRHTGNIMVSLSGRKVYAIDNENIVTTRWRDRPLFRNVVMASGYDPFPVWGMKIPEAIRQKVRNLEEGDLRAALAGMPKVNIDDTVYRLNVVKKWTHIPTDDELQRMV